MACCPSSAQAEPVIGQQPGGQAPVLRRLGVPDRLDRVPVPGEPSGGGADAARGARRRGTPQLQLQQVGEHLVVAEPGPPRIQRDHERAGLLQVLQHPLPAAAPGQQVGQLAADPLGHRGAQQQPPAPPRFAVPAPRPAGSPPPSARCRKTPRRTAPDRGARPATAPRAAARPPSPRSAHAAAPAAESGSCTPAASNSARASSRVNRRSAARISVSSPSSRSRCSPSRRSCRVASTNRSRSGARITSSSSWASASVEASSCTSSMTSQTRSSSRARSCQQPLHDRPAVQVWRRRQRPHQRRPGRRVPQRVGHRDPEPLRITLPALHRHPRRAPGQARLADPRPQQECLPAPRRRRHLGDPRCCRQPPEQRAAGRRPRSRQRRPERRRSRTGRQAPQRPL